MLSSSGNRTLVKVILLHPIGPSYRQSCNAVYENELEKQNQGLVGVSGNWLGEQRPSMRMSVCNTDGHEVLACERLCVSYYYV